PLSEPPQDPRPNLIAPVKAEAPPSVHPPPSAKPVQARAQLFVPSSRPAATTTVPGSGRPPPAPPSAAQPALPAPPLSAALKAAAASSPPPEGEEEEELLQRPDAPTIFDPDPAGEDKQPVTAPKPLAAWTERLLEAEAAETAVSRGISPKSIPQNHQSTNELQKSTPVGPITRSPSLRRVPPATASMSQPTPGPMMPGGVPAPPMGPQSIRMVTKFEIDDTLQSPQAHLVNPTPQGPSGSVRQIEIATPQPMHPQQMMQQVEQHQQQQQQQPYVLPPSPPPQTSSTIARVMFYGVLLMTAVITYAAVRHFTQGRSQPSAPTTATHAPAPRPQPQTNR
ncbi:MAG: hypothetical protein ABI183_04850, partial [Polyangiaceae bacterium]